MEQKRTFAAFVGNRLIASGDIQSTIAAAKALIDAGEAENLLIFEDQTGMQIDFDWRGTVDEVIGRLREHSLFPEYAEGDKSRNGPGRPKLGVVSREVSLLPRHWDWLEAQSGGISAALRRLVDQARKANPAKEEARRVRDAVSRIMWALAGDLPGFEEASRALFANDSVAFQSHIAEWPEDIRNQLTKLAATAFD